MTFTNWKTTLMGFIAAVLNYIVSLGPNLPTNGHDWGVVLISAALAALGLASKDFNVSNAPNPSTAKPVQ